jgi:CRISPR-associated protein Csb2
MRALVLQVRYLTGRSVATAYNDREHAEWPPHPARLYSALVATWAESEAQDAAERDALEWLANLDAPSIYASDASRRQVVPHFVPVNDVSVLGAFDRERDKLAELERTLEEAKIDYESAQRSGDKKAVEKVTTSLGKAEKALGTERQKVEKLMAADQQPYADGKHPETGLKSAWAQIPEHRGKQPRSFPSVSPDDPRVFLRWSAPGDDIERYTPALAVLAGRVVRVGHSASLVACSVVDDCPTPTWEPSDRGEDVLRVPGPDQFRLLLEAFERHHEIEPRVLPCRFQPYARVGEQRQEATARPVFSDDWIVFRQMSGRRLSQISCVELARAMRGALMTYADDPPPELLSGHTKSREPSEKPHLAIVPLPFVGHDHATGDLLGVALVFPRASDETERQAVLRAIGLWEDKRRADKDDELVDTPPLELTLGRAGVVEVERIEWSVAPLKTLRAESWCRPSHAWVTATPIALDRNPGNLHSRDRAEAEAAFDAAERSIATACERIGLPAPSYVQVHPSVPLDGTVKARTYPAFPADPKKNQRVKVHARIEFPVRVAGPVLLGAGRYFGLGLCFPQPGEARIQR